MTCFQEWMVKKSLSTLVRTNLQSINIHLQINSNSSGLNLTLFFAALIHFTTVTIVGHCLLNEATDEENCQSPYEVFKTQLGRLDYNAIIHRVEHHLVTHYGFTLPETISTDLWQEQVKREALVHERLIDTALLLFKIRFTHTPPSIFDRFCKFSYISIGFLIFSCVWFAGVLVYFLHQKTHLLN